MQFMFVIVILLALGIIMLVLTTFQSSINDVVQQSDMDNTSKVHMQAQSDATGGTFDAMVMLVLVGTWLLCLGLAYNSGSSPLLLVVALFIIVALAFAGMMLSNAWSAVADSVGLESGLAGMPMTNYVLSNFLVYILVVGFTTLMVSFSQRGGF
jgi:multidrug efflux pump subunit AcrB